MLEAKKSRWFEKIFGIYNRNLLKRRFNSLQISGLHFLKDKNANVPLIIYANHSSWWDGLVMLEILRQFDFENYVMMEEKQLRKLFFFRALGAFSVVRESAREAVKSLDYAANLLTENPNRVLLIFPQGEILANDVRPLRFYNGLSRVSEKVKLIQVSPVALRYEFLGNFKPEIFVKIGQPVLVQAYNNFNSKSMTESFERHLTETLDELKQNIILNNTSEYVRLF